VVHHQAAILGPNGRPVLHIVEQNPDFVQSIAVAVGSGPGRPLSPIDESGRSNSAIGGGGSSGKVNVHPVPTRSRGSIIGEDHLGVAKLIQKDNKFVHSIRVGSSNNNNKVPIKAEEPYSRLLSSSTPYPPPVTRKPSVTFSEQVELVLDNNGNGKLLVKNGVGGIPYRKPSTEQDSIVTESLLLMTSRYAGGQVEHGNNATSTTTGVSNNYNNNDANNSNSRISTSNNNKLFNHHHNNGHPSKSSSNSDGLVDGQQQLPSFHRKTSTDSSESDNAAAAALNGMHRTGSQRREDLEAFSTSIRKNHPVMHILSNSGKSLEINAAADHYSSAEFLEACHAVGDIDSRHYKPSYSSGGGENDEYTSTSSSSSHSSSSGHQHSPHSQHHHHHTHHDLHHHHLHETPTRSSSHSTAECEEQQTQEGRRRPNCVKSPFGGIADHYAAAKEIAKEIESYSNGDNAKSSSKKSECDFFSSCRLNLPLKLTNQPPSIVA
jgi:hypothetical protein